MANIFIFMLIFCEKFDIFIGEFKRIYNLSCPIKTKEIPCITFLKPWISIDIFIFYIRKKCLCE